MKRRPHSGTDGAHLLGSCETPGNDPMLAEPSCTQRRASFNLLSLPEGSPDNLSRPYDGASLIVPYFSVPCRPRAASEIRPSHQDSGAEVRSP